MPTDSNLPPRALGTFDKSFMSPELSPEFFHDSIFLLLNPQPYFYMTTSHHQDAMGLLEAKKEKKKKNPLYTTPMVYGFTEAP